jgi:hypothetical protein
VPVPNFEIHDPKLCAYEKATGKLVGEVALSRNAPEAPMTYMLNGKQFIAVPNGGANLPAELIALSLPWYRRPASQTAHWYGARCLAGMRRRQNDPSVQS